MQGIPLNERRRLGALLDDRPQTEVMAMIPQFSQAETDNFVAPPAQIMIAVPRSGWSITSAPGTPISTAAGQTAPKRRISAAGRMS